jgi:DNA mismatch endonuclease (patch repair protein)
LGQDVDKISKEKRSKIMASIHSKDTKPEIILREALSAKGLKYETHYGPERIDVAFPSERIAVFVDGCFWHGCPIHSHKVGTNEAYWQPKLERNKERDRLKNEKLESQHWTVLRFWEHELPEIDSVIDRINETIDLAHHKAH